MISWLNFGIALLKLVNGIMNWASHREAVDEGRQQVITKTLLAIAERTKVRDQLRTEIEAMSTAELDAELLRIGDARDVRRSPSG